MAYALPKGPRGDSPSDKGRRKPAPKPKKSYKLPKGPRGDSPAQRTADAKLSTPASVSGDAPALRTTTPTQQRRSDKAVRGGARALYKTSTPKQRAAMRRRGGEVGKAARQISGEWNRFERLADRGEKINRLNQAGKYRPTTQKQADSANRALHAYGLRASREVTKQTIAAAMDAARPTHSVQTKGYIVNNLTNVQYEGSNAVQKRIEKKATSDQERAKIADSRIKADAAQRSKTALKDSLGAVAKPKKLDKVKGKVEDKTSPADVASRAVAGFGLDKVVKEGGTQGVAMLKATKEDPGAVASSTLKSVPETLKAIPAGVVDTALHPVKTIKQTGQDYQRRYKGSVKQRAERMKKEGVLAEAADASILLGTAAAPIGRTTTQAARAGSFGSKVQRAASVARPAIRTSGGKVRYQRLADRPVRIAVQRLRDSRRAKADLRAVTRAEQRGVGADGLRAAAVKANRAAGETVQVTPRYRFTASKAQRKAVSKMKSGRLYLFKSEQRAKVDRTAGKAINQLNKAERKAFYYAASGTISTTPARAVEQLKALAQDIKDERAAQGTEAPKGLLSGNDQLKEIAWLIDNAETAFTPKLAETVRGLRRQDVEVAASDPALMKDGKPNAEQILTRRLAQQAERLGIRRGEIPADQTYGLAGRTQIDYSAAPYDVEATAKALRRRARKGKAVNLGFDPEASAKSILRHQRKLGKRPIFKPTPDAASYDPKPRSINERVWYHGTNVRGLTPAHLDGTQTQIDNLFGQGVYLTDDPTVAASYAGVRSGRKQSLLFGKPPKGEPTIYRSRINVKRVLDMEAPLDAKFLSRLEDAARAIGHQDPEWIQQTIRDGVQAYHRPTNSDAFREFQDAVAEYAGDYGLSKGDVTEYFQDLASALREDYDALTHVGGTRAGRGKKIHQVVIVLDPADTGMSGALNPVRTFGETDPFARPAEDAAQIKALSDQLRQDYGLRAGSLPDPPTAALEVKKYGLVGTPQLYDSTETVAQWARRVRKAADEQGLERPLYFPSEKYGNAPAYSERALGGTRATPKTFQYTGKLFREGLQNTDPKVYLSGLSRSIKRKHNWNLVADQLDTHAFEGLRNQKISWLRQRLAEDGIDEGSVSYWNPGVYRRALGEDDRLGNLEALDATDAARMGHEIAPDRVESAFRQAAFKTAAEIPTELKEAPGWSVVPRAVYNEVHAGTVPSTFTAAGRVWDIAKGKSSRYLLGSNPVWLQFQIGANAFQAAVGSAGESLLDLVTGATHRWWKSLDAETQARLNAEIGAGAGADAETPFLGAAVNNSFVNGYRDLKAHPLFDKRLFGVGPSLRQLNPFELVLGADRLQNDAFRRSMLYTAAKRDAVRRMGENMTGAAQMQARIVSLLKRPPDEFFRLGPDDVQAIEAHGKFVNDWLGDFTSFTHAERNGLKRFVMFYGFLRFSTRLAFYTLPVEHPLMTAIAVKLGQLQAEEVRDLLGGDELPWAFGKLYFTDDGELKEIDLAKMNPAINQLTGIDKLSQVFSVAPPFITMSAEQLLHRSFFTGSDWRAYGKAAPYAAKDSSYGLGARARIAFDDAASMLYPYRVAEKMTQDGPQGDDSILGSPRPISHKDKDLKKQDRKKAEFEDANESLLNELIAALPRPSRDKEAAQERRDFDNKKTQRRKPRGYGFGGGSYGSTSTGGAYGVSSGGDTYGGR